MPALRGPHYCQSEFLSLPDCSSFEPAEKRLSADALEHGRFNFVCCYGESPLADTIQTIDAMNVDMFICRARLAGTPQKLPSQPLMPWSSMLATVKDHIQRRQCFDLYTIRKNFAHLDGLKVAIVGLIFLTAALLVLLPALKTMGVRLFSFELGPPPFCNV